MPPAQLQSLLQQGIARHREGRFGEAVAIYKRVRAAAPRNFDAVHLLGVVALQQGHAAEAVELLQKAAALDPRHHVCRMRLGLALMSAGRVADAEPEFREAVRLSPDFVEGWDNLAYCLKAQDRLKEAIACHEKATTLNPRNPTSWHNYGLTLSLYGRISEALRCHERSHEADPSYAKALFGRGQALQQSHRIPEAIESYNRFLEREPRHWEAHSYRLFALNNLDDVSREDVFAAHVAFGRAVGEFPRPEFANEPGPERRIRLAILSPDLRAHSCAFFIEPLLRHLDPGQFELYLYHNHFREDAVSQRLKSMAAVWRNFVGRPNPEVERVIREDRPDVLIDLAGHTGLINRLPVFARHVAPVQITYLGYPNTTGLTAMHYRFTDEIVDPEGSADAFATERLVRFAPTAWAYQAPECAPEPSEPPCLAAPDAPITFGCYNNLAKVNDSTLALWARIIAAVPGSRLMLKGRGLSDESVRQRYFERCAAVGLPQERIVMLERTADTGDHLALYHRVDISLDTFPYHGTTTTCEALWMGVPVVTLMGDRHVARVSGSLLRAVGHPEWVAETPDDYVRIAVELAADRERLREVRAGLRGDMLFSPLLDHAGQAAHFGAAIRRCWQAWCESRVPVSG